MKNEIFHFDFAHQFIAFMPKRGIQQGLICTRPRHRDMGRTMKTAGQQERLFTRALLSFFSENSQRLTFTKVQGKSCSSYDFLSDERIGKFLEICQEPFLEFFDIKKWGAIFENCCVCYL